MRNWSVFVSTVVSVGLVGCSSSQYAPRAAGLNVPPDGFRALFDGKDLAGWQGLVDSPPKRAAMTAAEFDEAQNQATQNMREHWNVEEGVLHFDGKGASLVTDRPYGDFELILDWKIAAGGDSGIYLRGTPQVQIWDNPIGSGGLYNNQQHPSTPLVVADHLLGEWNTFRIVLLGDRVNVWLNDILVVADTPLENYWEREKPLYKTGPIELQAHGNPLWFRNIFIREITDPRNEPGFRSDLQGR